ncbi:MAG: tetratricopeptide repeat protein, partial [Terracidiphilus sp.]
VGHALDGDVDNLRERMIGAEMFGRPVSYDTGSDSVVRVRASEVRKKLAQYYSETKEDRDEVRIELPSGSYVPRFHFEPQQEPAGAPAFVSKYSENQQNGGAAVADAKIGSQDRRTGFKRFLSPRFAAAAFLALCLIALAGYWAARKWKNEPGSPKGIHAIAILPLENLSGSPDQNYFADGMTEELINDLGQVSTLRVISLTSSMSYKGTKKTLPEIAHELSVDGVVEGGVLREGNQVRVSVQLIDARNDRPIWAHTYVRDLSGVSSWQGEVAQAIADEVSSDVTPQQQAQLTRKSSVDPVAQDNYLHGILLREADDCKDAIADFNRAIDKDPSYAQAHSALASCYGMLGESGRMPYEQAFGLQKTEALKAIALDDYLSEAHAELANTAMTLDWDWPVAEAEFHRALELNPNSATNHEKYAFYLVRTGHPNEALAEIQHSVDLDPVSGSTFHAEGFVYYFSHQYDQALAVARTVRGLKINLSDWNLLTGASYAEKGIYSDAIAAFLKSGNGAYALGHLGNAYARAGRKQAAQELITQLEEDVRKQGVGRYEIALIYAGLGDSRDAFKWLDDAYRAHDVGLVYLNVDPCLDSLRGDPRFEDLVRRVGLTKQN